MAKVTSKYQVTVSRKVAEEYHLRPGDDVDWVPAGEAIRVIPRARKESPQGRESRLHWFDQATERQRKRRPASPAGRPGGRGWNREDLYGRGRSR